MRSRLNLYRISQNAHGGWDAYDSAVVCAESEEAARRTHPNGWSEVGSTAGNYDWASEADVKVELIGTAREGILAGVVVASFNGG